jgi:hypothetical protein
MAQARYVEGFDAARPAVIVRTKSSTAQAFQVLRFGVTLAPIIAGIDKFTGRLVDWQQYLAPTVLNAVAPTLTKYIPPVLTSNAPLSARGLLMIVCVIEILMGLLVAVKPSIGGWVVAVWLWAVIANLVLAPSHYDIAVRDFALSLCALALARLAVTCERGRS